MASHSNLRYPHLGFRIGLDVIAIVAALGILGFVDLSHFAEIPAVAVYALTIYVSVLAFIYIIYLLRHRRDILTVETKETA